MQTNRGIPNIYNCNKKILYPPKNFIKYNCFEGYRDSVIVDACLADEIEDLWSKGIKTTGCCCGHGEELGSILVTNDCIPMMEELGYVHYIFKEDYGENRNDAFIPKSYGHIYDGYSDGFMG